MSDGGYPAEFAAWARSLPMSRRAALTLDLILKQGSVTTGDLNAIGYDHPPRAVRDLKDAGLAVDKDMVTVDGKRMARYFLVTDSSNQGRASRRPLPLAFRKRLFEIHGHKCSACGGRFLTRFLQADHRVPFEIGGDPEPITLEAFMPLCGSDNRAKSMSCETCPNWELGSVETCRTCYWHDPDNYQHIATHPERRLTITFQGGQVAIYDRAGDSAQASGQTLPEFTIRALDESS